MIKQNIQIAHSSVLGETEISNSRAVAELRLKNKTFREGEFAVVSYKGEDNSVQALVAIGTKNGNFRTLNAGNVISVRKISDWRDIEVPEDVAPDVSQLVDEQIYILRCSISHPEKGISSGDWVKAFINDSQVRDFEKLGNTPCIFLELESGYHWFYKIIDGKQRIYREDDLFTYTDANAVLDAIANLNLSISVSTPIIDIKNTEDKQKDLTFTATPGDCIDKIEWYIDDKKVAERGTHSCKGWIANEGTHKLKGIYLVGETGFTIDVYSTFRVRYTYPIYYGMEGSTLSTTYISKEENFIIKDLQILNKCLVFEYPKFWGSLTSIIDQNGLEYINSYNKSTDTSTSPHYYKYTLINPITISGAGFSQTYVLNQVVKDVEIPEEDPPEIPIEAGEGTYSLIQKASGSNTAKGESAAAFGSGNSASKDYSFATGFGTKALSPRSFTSGSYTKTSNSSEAAFGKYNNTTNNTTIFSVGVGNDDNSRYNALEISRDGEVYVKGIGNYNGKNISSANTIQDVIGNGYTFLGYANPNTQPGTPKSRCYYIAEKTGNYNHFGSLTQVTQGSILYYNTTDGWRQKKIFEEINSIPRGTVSISGNKVTIGVGDYYFNDHYGNQITIQPTTQTVYTLSGDCVLTADFSDSSFKCHSKKTTTSTEIILLFWDGTKGFENYGTLWCSMLQNSKISTLQTEVAALKSVINRCIGYSCRSDKDGI